MLKKSRIVGAIAAAAAGLLLMGSPAQADDVENGTINQTNNLVPITVCENEVAIIGIVVDTVLASEAVDCDTATTGQAGDQESSEDNDLNKFIEVEHEEDNDEDHDEDHGDE